MAMKKPAKKAAKTSSASRKTATPTAKAVRSGTSGAAKKAPASKAADVAATQDAQQYKGGCHCGRIAFEVAGSIEHVMDCNCSMCQRRGGLLWFVPRSAMRLTTPESSLWTYTFNKHLLKHHFCANCGIAPFSEGEKQGEKMASINVRCLEGIDLSKIKVVKYNGRGA